MTDPVCVCMCVCVCVCEVCATGETRPRGNQGSSRLPSSTRESLTKRRLSFVLRGSNFSCMFLFLLLIIDKCCGYVCAICGLHSSRFIFYFFVYVVLRFIFQERRMSGGNSRQRRSIARPLALLVRRSRRLGYTCTITVVM